MASHSFMAGGRKRRIFQKKPGGMFHVRFEHAGREVIRSLGTTLSHVAIIKAKQLVTATVERQPTHGEVSAVTDFRLCPLPSQISVAAIRMPIIATPAIYFLLKGGRVCYVGQSNNVLLRIGQHFRDAEKQTSRYDEFAYIPTPIEKLNDEEMRYIALFSPFANRSRGGGVVRKCADFTTAEIQALKPEEGQSNEGYVPDPKSTSNQFQSEGTGPNLVCLPRMSDETC